MQPLRLTVKGEPVVKGEAQVMVVRGTKRWFYDFNNLEIQFAIQYKPLEQCKGEACYEGTLSISELSSNDTKPEEAVNGAKIHLNKGISVPEGHQSGVNLALKRLKEAVVQKILDFENVYHSKH